MQSFLVVSIVIGTVTLAAGQSTPCAAPICGGSDHVCSTSDNVGGTCFADCSGSCVIDCSNPANNCMCSPNQCAEPITSPGEIAGIVVGVCVCIGCIAACAGMTCYQKSRTQNIQYAPVPNGTFGHPAGNNAGQAAGYPSQSNPPSNPPKIQSDYFVSHTQRNGQATTLATDLHASLKENGMNVWLDVKMENRSMTAMKEGVVNSSCVIAVITGPCHNPDDPDALPGTNAYFSRPFCVQELRWAKEAQIPIQPVIRAADKSRIGELMALAPDDLQFVGNIDFITLDRSDVDYWEVGIQKILRAANKVKRTPSGQGAAAAPGLAQPFYPGAPPPPYMVPAAAATPYYTAPYTTSPPPTAPLMVTDMPTYGSSIHREHHRHHHHHNRNSHGGHQQ
mmetsp:Transcript_23013/g.60105  ORF Transcript_23013/g.60105 Transcript_23013/m.60105 type:complete len:393 (-) Transcript_23013:177-1355(-)